MNKQRVAQLHQHLSDICTELLTELHTEEYMIRVDGRVRFECKLRLLRPNESITPPPDPLHEANPVLRDWPANLTKDNEDDIPRSRR